MTQAGVPTARAITVETVDDADRAIEALGAPVVVKASGLAAGKGVIVCETSSEAKLAARSMLEAHAFGEAGATVLVEEFMEGEELSVFVLTDGTRTAALPASRCRRRGRWRTGCPGTGAAW